MATVIGTVVTKQRRVTVTWANVVTADTITAHLPRTLPIAAAFQHNGTYANGTSVGLTVSLDQSTYETSKDLDGANVSGKLASAFHNIQDLALGYLPTIASGSSDSITFTLAYWVD